MNLTGYKLTFDDEFSNLSVSQTGQNTVWADIRPYWRLNPDADIGFGDSAFVDPASGIDPFSIQNGALNIQAVQTSNPVVGTGPWASGLLQTQNSFSQEYGYFEMRAQLPADAGVWPAFWMMPENDSWPPELDIFEAYGTSDLYQTVHTGITGSDTTQVTWSNQPGMLSGFHTYGVLWTPDQITFYFDGTQVGQQATPADFHQPMYLLIDLAMQAVAGVSSDAKSMQVDYVRAYSDAADATGVPLGTVSSPDGLDTADLYGATAAPPLWADYEGADTSGLLMTNDTTGALVLAQAQGDPSETFTQIGGLGPQWQFEGYGDFLGDGTGGFLLWNDSSGAIVVGEDDNGTAQYTQVGGVGSQWEFEGAGQFSGAATTDFLLWNNATGALVVSEVSNGAAGYTQIGGVGADWQFEGVGDYLGDGTAGFLMENASSGALVVGEDVGGAAQYTQVGGLGPEWQFEGTGDLLGHGRDDFLIWNNSTDALVVGEVVDGAAQYTQIGGVGSEWQFLGVGNYDGASNSEFLMRDGNNGTLVIGTVVNNSVTYQTVGGVGSEWNLHAGNPALLG